MSDKILALGLLGGMAMLWLWSWGNMRMMLKHERQIIELRANGQVEQRCGFCLNYPKCLARNTGVLYPCPHFKTEDEHGDEE